MKSDIKIFCLLFYKKVSVPRGTFFMQKINKKSLNIFTGGTERGII